MLAKFKTAFISSRWLNYVVFTLFSTIYLVSSERCDCQNKIIMLLRYDDYRVLLSPDYPKPYCGELNCAWRVVAPDNTSKIHFFARNIDFRENRDFIWFFDSQHGVDLEHELINASHSCTGKGDCAYESKGQFLTIQFKSDFGEPERYGFQATVSLYDRERRAWTNSIWKIVIIALVCVAVIIGLTVIFWLLVCRRFLHKEKVRLLSQDEEEAATIAAKQRESSVYTADVSSNAPNNF
uniref:CUB domain-containing protein n=1 Tax=Panagrellus redivivus TaxID=6233 RepID=A0A7E4VKP0_PANRE